MRTYVIAECGSCHDGSLRKIEALVGAARDAGADAVKFQYWSDPDRLADRRGVPDAYREIYRRYGLRDEHLCVAAGRADDLRLDFMCTAYLPEDVPYLARFVRHFKVASFEAESGDLLAAHRPFLQQHFDRLLFVSLGMGARRPTDESFGPERSPACAAKVRALHCVSAYPAPAEALGLARLRWEDAERDCPVYDGFSDHSDPALTWTGALAAAAGARYLEAHLRLRETDDANPDAPHAMLPEQFRDYVRHVRFAEVCRGDEWGGAHACEAEMARYRVRP